MGKETCVHGSDCWSVPIPGGRYGMGSWGGGRPRAWKPPACVAGAAAGMLYERNNRIYGAMVWHSILIISHGMWQRGRHAYGGRDGRMVFEWRMARILSPPRSLSPPRHVVGTSIRHINTQSPSLSPSTVISRIPRRHRRFVASFPACSRQRRQALLS